MQQQHHHHGHDTEVPVQPGYPEHPELSRPPAPAGTAQRQSYDRMTHAGHGAAGPSAGHGGAHGSHDKHAGHSVAMFRDKFWISLLLTIPTLVWGHMLQRAFGYTPPAIQGPAGSLLSSGRQCSCMAGGLSSRAPSASCATGCRA